MNIESLRSVSREVSGRLVANDDRVSSDGRAQADHLAVLIHGYAIYMCSQYSTKLSYTNLKA